MFIKNFKTFFIGFCMGTVDIVPGVSGGTIALATGIYERLVNAIHSVLSIQTAKEVRTFKFAALWKRIDGTFLVQLGTGIIVGIFSMANLIAAALVYLPWYTWGVFFGAVLFSVWIVLKQVRRWTITEVLLVIIGAILAFSITILHSITTPDTALWLLLSGAIASCAMILPGISGSFLLVLLGKYSTVIGAVKTGDVATILIVGTGAGLGLLLFSAVLKRLLDTLHNQTFAMLAGLILGSVSVLWPWSQELEVSKFALTPPVGALHDGIIIACILLGMGVMYSLYRITK